MQTLSLGMDMRKRCSRAFLCEITGAKGVYERNDVLCAATRGWRCRRGFYWARCPSA